MATLIFFLSLLLILLSSKYVNACTVCMEEKLITSSVKCPVSSCEPSQSNRQCFKAPKLCDPNSKYRTIDGSCNNLANPSWGMSNTPFIRYVHPVYYDKKHSLRRSSDGTPLPLAREITTHIFSNETEDDRVSLVTMQWGQFITHDMTISLPGIDSNVYCCDRSLPNFDNICLPLHMPQNDYFYSNIEVPCIGEVRTMVSYDNYCCQNGPAQQINGNTHYMDASLTYGSTNKVAMYLRELKGGRMKIQKSQNGREFLPQVNPPIEDNCYVDNLNQSCYVGGDLRINQNTDLTILQTIFLREHNRIAKKLGALNKNWDDETIYQETRKIVIATSQHITYNEFLPLYLGEKTMHKHKLYSKKTGRTQYNSNFKPIIANSFATSAFRLSHSGIQENLEMCDYGRKVINSISLTEFSNRPNIIQQSNHLDELILGFTTQLMHKFGPRYESKIMSKLFQFYSPFGHDLVSLDIQRGRDHGLGPYVRYLEICTGYKARTFEDLKLYIPERKVVALKELYNNVQDIDLHVGGVLENIVPGARFGPTFLCIITEQFYRVKYGDRFWYDAKSDSHGFTEQQLQEIKKVTLSRILCDNSDNIITVAANSFKPPSASNPIKKCKNMPKVDLNKWKEM